MKRVIMAAMMIVLIIVSMAVPAFAATKTGDLIKQQYPRYIHFEGTNREYYIVSDGDVYFGGGWIRPTTGSVNFKYFDIVKPGGYVWPLPGTTAYSENALTDYLGALPQTIVNIEGTMPLYTNASKTATIFTPPPEEYNYNVNPGDYVRFTKEGSESWGILVNVVSGNEPYMQIRNYNASGHVNTYFASPLSSISVLTNDHIDIDLKSTRNNEPLVITTTAEMETLSTGGTPPPDGTTNQELTLSTNPDTAIFTNLTGETQYISYWREEIGENQFTQIKVESKVGNYWQVMGATPQIKDVKVRKIPIAANVRYTIFNNNGSTKITYPVTEGFNVQTLTQGVYNEPGQGGGIALPDDPSIITDPGSIYPNVPIPERPDDVLGLLNWAADLTLEFITAMGAAVGGMFQFLQKFGTLFGAITFLPAEFTIAFTMLIIVSLALRVVGR